MLRGGGVTTVKKKMEGQFLLAGEYRSPSPVSKPKPYVYSTQAIKYEDLSAKEYYERSAKWYKHAQPKKAEANKIRQHTLNVWELLRHHPITDTAYLTRAQTLRDVADKRYLRDPRTILFPRERIIKI